jgi:exosortase
MSSGLSSISSTEISAQPGANGGDGSLSALLRGNALAIACYLLVAIPTLIRLSQENWSTEAGAHGPIVLATGLWLLHHCMDELKARKTAQPPFWLMLMLLVPLVAAYALGRALDLLVMEAAAVVAFGYMLLVRRIGFGPLWARPFPFFYLAMLIPPPGWVIDSLTMRLQHMISNAAASLLSFFDYPVQREGVVILIAQYQLLVEDACSGMNSLFGLIAISLFYIYLLHRADWKHSLALLVAILPISIFVNLIRVLVLILITYYFGDAVAQGFIHNFAGILLFALSLSMMVLTDLIIRRLFRTKEAKAV